MSKSESQYDLIKRGEKKPTLTGTLAFVLLRLADIPLQHALLTPAATGLGVSLLTSLGLRTIFTHNSALSPNLLLPLNTTSPNWLTRLTPTGVILLLMSAGSAAKQIYWQVVISQESFPVGAAAAVSGYNSALSTMNSLLFLALSTTSLASSPHVGIPGTSLSLPLSTAIGATLYIAGLIIEALSESQRAAFKARPENKGKVCKVGLWRWARHINYFGYAMWRGGYCMVGSGWIGGLAMGAFQAWDLGTRAVGVLDSYCADRYKEQWSQFKKEVPYTIVPGIY
ncbi:hypothetical protein GGR57DRAFT_500124 [Xylariaceae sp. FL1272]|nr:hypothetical protein GGR57DRAFT_500124 [Xylariaceae sp. FL1272]